MMRGIEDDIFSMGNGSSAVVSRVAQFVVR
jgi:hypothetical protein